MASLSGILISHTEPANSLENRIVGGKAKNLFCLSWAGFPVPPWLVVSSKFLDAALTPHRAQLNRLVAHIDHSHLKNVEKTAHQIACIINEIALAPTFCKALHTSLAQMEGTLFAVRSSVIGEDSADHSFAGQMDSLLNVPACDVLGAIKKVWASAFSARALAYRKQKKIATTAISTAVIVQQMVQSEKSGILFTCDPENRNEQIVISAGLGLGEGIVSNRVETDTYRIARLDNAVQQQIPRKQFRLVRSHRDRGGLRTEPVPTAVQTQPVLSHPQIHHLKDLGMRIEQHFGSPQDIEWAFDKTGNLFLLQARPIVFPANRCNPPVTRIWDSLNIVESYPGLTLPLSFTFAQKNYEIAFQNAALGFQFCKKPLKKNLHIFKHMIGLLDGRVYYNLLNWYTMLSYLPGFKQRREAWDQMIGIHQSADLPRTKHPRWLIWSNLPITIYRFITGRMANKTFFTHFDRAYRHFQDLDLSAFSEDELISLYESLLQSFAPRWHLTLYNDFFP